MKQSKATWMMLVAVMLCVLCGWQVEAAGLYRLSTAEAAYHRATHVYVCKDEDLTDSTAGRAQTNTFSVAAKQGISIVKAILPEAFVDDATNGNNTLTLVVGDGTDADLFLQSMELNSNGTEVYCKAGRGSWQTATTLNAVTGLTTATTATMTNATFTTTAFTTNLTLTTITLTNMAEHGFAGDITIVSNAVVLTSNGYSGHTPLTVNAYTTVTPVTTAVHSALTQSEGYKVYTSADTVDIVFSPHASYACSAPDAEVRIYFIIDDAR